MQISSEIRWYHENIRPKLTFVSLGLYYFIGNFSFPGFVVITFNAHFGVQ